MKMHIKRQTGSNSPLIEMLEGWQLLSGGPSPAVYAPDADVKGQSIARWSADWWSRVFETPVHAADGTTVINPTLTEGSVFSDKAIRQENQVLNQKSDLW